MLFLWKHLLWDSLIMKPVLYLDVGMHELLIMLSRWRET